MSLFLCGGITSASAATTEAEDLCNEMAANVQTHEASAIARVQEAWTQNINADQTNPQKNIRGDVKKRSCIGYVFTIMDTIRGLISKVSAIEAMIEAIVKTLLEQVCNYIAAAINNVLASVCLPIPNFGLSMSLPSMSSKSCNGLSLLSVIQMQSNSYTSNKYYVPAMDPPSYFHHPLTRGLTLKNGARE